MAQNLAPKQLNFVDQFTKAVVQLLSDNKELLDLLANWNGNAYATGAEPTSNNITDDVLSGNSLNQQWAYMTASQLNEAVGAVKTVNDTIAANRGYLEAMRP
jgi:hypothetical protein